MHEFTVWAPRPGQVDLVLDGRRIPMERSGGRLVEPSAAAGCDYGFSLDGGPPRPDPRSAFQPDGVHGRPGWSTTRRSPGPTRGWRGLAAAPAACCTSSTSARSRAAGTFDGAIEHLDHLVDLGVDAIELMPVAEFSGPRGWGYDGVDLFAPHHAYGGPDGLKRLVDAAHDRGLGVVLDVVYNHLGPAGNYLPEFGPYFSARHQTSWGDARQPRRARQRRGPAVRASTTRCPGCATTTVDGLRLDAVHAIVDDSAVHICEQLAAEVEALAAQRAAGRCS